jgi:hypothetical protein
MNAKLSVILILAVTFTISCANRQRLKYVPGTAVASNETDNRGVSISIEWLKNKENSVDIMAILRNNYESSVKIKKSAIKIRVGDQPGFISKSDFSGELAANGGTERGLLIFKFAGPVPKTGTATLLISEISSEDGKKHPDLMIAVPAVHEPIGKCDPVCHE